MRSSPFYLWNGIRPTIINNLALPLSTTKNVFQKKLSKKETDITKIRNLGVMAHIDAGKTTTTERILYYTGFSRYMGNVDDGSTVTDYMEQERDRGITITSAAITCYWKKHKINLIDTPGHVDFTVEVERALRVLDGAVAILDASAGVEAQTLTVWRQAERYSIPRLIFLNKLDKPNANVELSLKSVREKLNTEPLLLSLPIKNNGRLEGLIDLISMQKWHWSSEISKDGREYNIQPIDQTDSELLNDALIQRTQLIGQLSDLDEKIAEYVLSKDTLEEIPSCEIHSAIRRVTLLKKAVAVICGSSLKNKGVQHLLDAITLYLPSPLDVKHDFVDFYKNSLVCLAFKIIHDKQRGMLTFLRIYNGEVKSGTNIYNVNQKKTEKVNRLLQVDADEFQDISQASSGNIVCVSGFKETITGDTLVSSASAAQSAQRAHKNNKSTSAELLTDDTESLDTPVLAGLEIPSPVFFCSVEAPSASSQKDLDYALECLQREDPSLSAKLNPDTGQTILCGMGELHLEIVQNRILTEYGIDAHLGPLQVAYKETVKKEADITEVLDTKVGDHHHYVMLRLSVEPSSERNFHHVELVHTKENTLTTIRRNHLNAIENGIKSALAGGPVLNFPVIHVSVSLHDFVINRGTSLPMVSACSISAMQKALQEANTVLMEPIMKIQVTCGELYLPSILGDLAQRRSNITSIQSWQNLQIIHATTPISELMGYSTALRTISSGMATFSLELSHYEALSTDLQNKVIEETTGFSQSL